MNVRTTQNSSFMTPLRKKEIRSGRLSSHEATGSDDECPTTSKNQKPIPKFASSRPSSMLDKEEQHLDMIIENDNHQDSTTKLPGILIDYNQTMFHSQLPNFQLRSRLKQKNVFDKKRSLQIGSTILDEISSGYQSLNESKINRQQKLIKAYNLKNVRQKPSKIEYSGEN